MSPKTSSHSTPLPKCTLLTCLEFAFSNPPHLPLLLCFSYEITSSLPPHQTPSPSKAPFPRLLKYFTCGRLGRAGPRAQGTANACRWREQHSRGARLCSLSHCFLSICIFATPMQHNCGTFWDLELWWQLHGHTIDLTPWITLLLVGFYAHPSYRWACMLDAHQTHLLVNLEGGESVKRPKGRRSPKRLQTSTRRAPWLLVSYNIF